MLFGELQTIISVFRITRLRNLGVVNAVNSLGFQTGIVI